MQIRNTSLAIGKDTLYLTEDVPTSNVLNGTVLITPAFGITAKRIFSLSYFLTQNGFRVFRLDFRNHVGESSGDIENANLTTQVEDIEHAIKSTNCDIVLSISLSARATFKALANKHHNKNAVFIAPVVDVRHTLEQACDPGVLEAFTMGSPSENVLGYDVKRFFMEDCIDNGFETLETTLKDFAKLEGKQILIAGESDPWVSYEHIKAVGEQMKANNKNIKTIPINSASHKIDRNPKIALTYFETATRECMQLMGVATDNMKVPSFREIIQEANNN